MSAPPVSEPLAANLRPRSSSPTPTPFGLGFLAPEEETTIPSPAPSPETLEQDEASQDSGELYDEVSDPSDSPGATSSRASTRDAEPSTGLRDFARNGVIIASAQAHQYLGSRTEGQRAVALYQADNDDAENIGDPLARIAERRDGVGEMSPDSKDLLAAMMGLAGYASKQIQKAAVASKLDARIAGGLEQAAPEPVDL